MIDDYEKLAEWAIVIMMTMQLETANILGASLALKAKYDKMDENDPELSVTGKELAVLAAILTRRMEEVKEYTDQLNLAGVLLPEIDEMGFIESINKTKEEAFKYVNVMLDKKGREDTMSKIMTGINANFKI